MLSKYFHLDKTENETTKVDMKKFISAFVENMKEKYTDVRLEVTQKNGTLGVFFDVFLEGKKRFVKTHQSGIKYRRNLEKEIEVMQLVYKGIVEVEKIEIEIDNEKQIFMVMDYLYAIKPDTSMEKIENCINDYQKKLSKKNIDIPYTFEDVITAGEKSLKSLYDLRCISTELYQMCRQSVQIVKKLYIKRPTTICHGDLSNVNIMCTVQGELVVIDWEDSLIAFQEYDFLYWLTFFSQRKYYSTTLLERCGIEKRWGVDVMILVTLVKCYMSYQSGSYKANSLSFESRLKEIYEMIEMEIE